MSSTHIRSLSFTTCYTSADETEHNNDLSFSPDRGYTSNDGIESLASECEYGSTCTSKKSIHTEDSCSTNPTMIEATPSQYVSISASRLRYLEYLERNLSSIVNSAVEENVK